MTTDSETGQRKRGIMQPRAGNIYDWQNDPEFQQACRDAEAVGAMKPNVLDWAQYQAENARAKK